MIIITKNGISKKVATGFSWKALLFGILYTASRGDIKGFFIQAALSILTCNLYQFVMPFVVNKIYLRRMIENGWIIKDWEGI